ncbi:TPA: hypothetical protein IAB29_01540 [Candidatus Ventrenecus stercoripullorum]|nr:hypothetical protein [Candidatus Ventrenecus stercoripullorum]
MKKKSKTIIIVSAFLVVSLTAIGTVGYLRKDLSNNNLKDDDSTEIKINQNVPSQELNDSQDATGDENIINIEVHPFYGHEPDLEFLTSAADLIVSGTIDTSSLNYEVENTFIYTDMNIQVTKVYKNNSASTYSTSGNNNLSSLNIKSMGGKLSAKDYVNSLDESHKAKYSLNEEELETYSFSLDTSNGKLDYKEANTEYLFFLNNINGSWVPNSNHYGIRKIEGNKVYDYETDTYIETDLLN